MNTLMWIYLASPIIVLLDQLTKFLSRRFLSGGESIPIIENVFHLTLVRNKGIAFGLFSEIPSLLFALIVVCILILIAMTFSLREGRWQARLALAFILGGALGNLVDRLVLGYVTDFLDFRIWPVFNVADAFVSTGVILLALLMIKR